MACEIDAEGEIDFSQVGGHAENQAELAGNDIVLIAENWNRQIVLLDDLASKLRP